MKGHEMLAREYAVNWTKPRLPEAEIAALEAAYLAGFRKARLMAASLLGTLPDPNTKMLGILVQAIGERNMDAHEDNDAKE